LPPLVLRLRRKEAPIMVTKKKLSSISELQDIQRLAVECPSEVGLQSPDGSIIIDAKSYIGMYALDFSQPVLIVSEDAGFHKQIQNIGQNVT